ncbi:hypothetical protein D3C81_1363220 [compost metagenome]
MFVALYRHARAKDQRRNVEVPHGDEAGAEHARIMVGHDQEHGVFPVRRLLGAGEELPQRPVRVARGVFHAGGRVAGLDAPGRVFPRRVIGDAERHGETRLAVVLHQTVMQLVEHVLVRCTPRTDEAGLHFKPGPVDHLIETIAEEERLHVVEVRLAAVEEA